jgi:hypothetical protein
MKSPFPGMDPYIEGCGLFEDFHFDLIAEMKNELARVLPKGYIVKTGERAYVVLAGNEQNLAHAFMPDVGVVNSAQPATASDSASVAVAEPDADAESVPMRAFVNAEYREDYLEIYDSTPGRTLVTSIEVLSPSNKRKGTRGWKKYLRKRQGLLGGTANFVEIDLLRGGTSMPMFDAWPAAPYRLLVARRKFAPSCRVWSGHFQRPLPTIPVPLLRPDPDVALPLQSMVEAVYARFRYDEQIDYGIQVKPPLTAEESAWLAQRLQERSA